LGGKRPRGGKRGRPAARRTNFLSPSSLNNKRTWFQKNSGQLFIIISLSLSLALPLSVDCVGSFYSSPFFLVHEAWLLHFLSPTTTSKCVNINKKSESCTASLSFSFQIPWRGWQILSAAISRFRCSFPALRRRHSAAVMDLCGGMLQSPRENVCQIYPGRVKRSQIRISTAIRISKTVTKFYTNFGNNKIIKLINRQLSCYSAPVRAAEKKEPSYQL
jgi:hypothetical protein